MDVHITMTAEQAIAAGVEPSADHTITVDVAALSTSEREQLLRFIHVHRDGTVELREGQLAKHFASQGTVATPHVTELSQAGLLAALAEADAELAEKRAVIEAECRKWLALPDDHPRLQEYQFGLNEEQSRVGRDLVGERVAQLTAASQEAAKQARIAKLTAELEAFLADTATPANDPDAMLRCDESQFLYLGKWTTNTGRDITDIAPDLMAAVRVRVDEVNARIRDRRKAEAEEAKRIEAARVAWLAENLPMAARKLDAGYRADRDIYAELTKRLPTIFPDASIEEVVPNEVRGRTTPSDAAFLTAERLVADHSDKVASATVVWILMSADACGDVAQFEAIEVEIRAPWAPDQVACKAYFTAPEFAGQDGDGAEE